MLFYAVGLKEDQGRQRRGAFFYGSFTKQWIFRMCSFSIHQGAAPVFLSVASGVK